MNSIDGNKLGQRLSHPILSLLSDPSLLLIVYSSVSQSTMAISFAFLGKEFPVANYGPWEFIRCMTSSTQMLPDVIWYNSKNVILKIIVTFYSKLLHPFSYMFFRNFLTDTSLIPLCFSFLLWEKIIKLFCIFSALLLHRTLGCPLGLLSFWPGAHKTRQALGFWQLIQVQSNLAQSLKVHST